MYGFPLNGRDLTCNHEFSGTLTLTKCCRAHTVTRLVCSAVRPQEQKKKIMANQKLVLNIVHVYNNFTDIM